MCSDAEMLGSRNRLMKRKSPVLWFLSSMLKEVLFMFFLPSFLCLLNERGLSWQGEGRDRDSGSPFVCSKCGYRDAGFGTQGLGACLIEGDFSTLKLMPLWPFGQKVNMATFLQNSLV